jgi:hypothetical protein
MISIEIKSDMEHNDTELVLQSLTGNREAFCRIVEQYQSLICSLAYSATGSVSQSEDVAQETFVVAWKQLRQLREPEKLRSWLCSIARSVIHVTRRVIDCLWCPAAPGRQRWNCPHSVNTNGRPKSQELDCRNSARMLYSELKVLGQFGTMVLLHFWHSQVQMRSLCIRRRLPISGSGLGRQSGGDHRSQGAGHTQAFSV